MKNNTSYFQILTNNGVWELNNFIQTNDENRELRKNIIVQVLETKFYNETLPIYKCYITDSVYKLVVLILHNDNSGKIEENDIIRINKITSGNTNNSSGKIAIIKNYEILFSNKFNYKEDNLELSLNDTRIVLSEIQKEMNNNEYISNHINNKEINKLSNNCNQRTVNENNGILYNIEKGINSMLNNNYSNLPNQGVNNKDENIQNKSNNIKHSNKINTLKIETINMNTINKNKSVNKLDPIFFNNMDNPLFNRHNQNLNLKLNSDNYLNNPIDNVNLKNNNYSKEKSLVENNHKLYGKTKLKNFYEKYDNNHNYNKKMIQTTNFSKYDNFILEEDDDIINLLEEEDKFFNSNLNEDLNNNLINYNEYIRKIGEDKANFLKNTKEIYQNNFKFVNNNQKREINNDCINMNRIPINKNNQNVDSIDNRLNISNYFNKISVQRNSEESLGNHPNNNFNKTVYSSYQNQNNYDKMNNIRNDENFITNNNTTNKSKISMNSLNSNAYLRTSSHIFNKSVTNSISTKNISNTNTNSFTKEQINQLNNNRKPDLIRTLSTFSKNIFLRIRVLFKSEKKGYQSNTKNVFNFNVIDSEGSEMPITCFDSSCEKFFDLIQTNNLYEINGGYLKINDKKFTRVNSDLKLYLDESTTIQKISEQSLKDFIPIQKYNFVKIEKIAKLPLNKIIDVLCYVLEVKENKTVLSKKSNKSTNLTILKVTDETLFKTDLSIWGNYANENYYPGQVLALRYVKIGEFKGRNISVCDSVSMQIDPEFSEAIEMKEKIRNNNQNFKELPNYIEEMYGIKDNEGIIIIKISDLNNYLDSLNVENITLGDCVVKATVLQFLHSEKNFYSGCPICKKKFQIEENTNLLEDNNNFNLITNNINNNFDIENSIKKNNINLDKNSNNEKSKNRNDFETNSNSNKTYYCMKCKQNYENYVNYFHINFLIRDLNGELSIDILGENAEYILGVKCDEYKFFIETNIQEKLNEISNNIEMQTFYFTLAPRIAFIENKRSKKFTCVKFSKIEIYDKFYLEEIKKYKISLMENINYNNDPSSDKDFIFNRNDIQDEEINNRNHKELLCDSLNNNDYNEDNIIKNNDFKRDKKNNDIFQSINNSIEIENKYYQKNENENIIIDIYDNTSDE